MKGIVFTEFVEMVEAHHSADLVDDLIDSCDLASGGSYTSVGTYDHREMVQLVMALSEKTGTPVPALLKAFGEYLFGRFLEHFPKFFAGIDSAIQLLSGIEEVIHAEVLKLYPDAQLPKFDVEMTAAGGLTMVYRSPRHLEDLAEGLITACIHHYGHPVALRREVITDAHRSGTCFTLTPVTLTPA